MSALPVSRGIRESTDGNDYEVVVPGGVDSDDEDEEDMFEFDSETEAQEYERGQAALVKELTEKKANEANPSTAAAASSTSATATGGMATVVQVESSVSADGEVKVGLDVFDRYVPHLNAKSATDASTTELPNESEITSSSLKSATTPAAATSSTKSTTMADSDSSDNDSDAESEDADRDATGADLVLTGDLEKDSATLSKLMAGKDTDMKDADASSDDDESDTESDEEDIARRAEAATLEDIGSDEEPEHIQRKSKGVYTKNELKPDQIPPPAEFEVTGDLLIEEIGNYQSHIDRLLVIQSASGRSKVLDIGSAICTSDRKPVGRVEEVMGLVSEPYYAVRLCTSFNPSILPDPLEDDVLPTKLFYVPSLSSFAQADSRPGTDASNLHDEEVGEDEQEFSDDEAEAEARSQKKQANKAKVLEKKKAAAIAAGLDPNALPGARPTFKAKRTQRNQTTQQQPQQTSPSKFVPRQPFTTGASSNAPLLPMPGTQPAQPQQFQPAYPMHPQQPYAPYGYPAYPTHDQQQQQAAYAQYYQQHPQAAVYYPPPTTATTVPSHPSTTGYPQSYPSPYGATGSAPVSGGFAGWGPQNTLAPQPHQPSYGYQQPYATPTGYGYQPQPYGYPPQGGYAQPSQPYPGYYPPTTATAAPSTATVPTTQPPQ